jgi:hypothetical protein
MGEWRKFTYSGANGGSCVEVASAEGVAVTVIPGAKDLQQAARNGETFDE